MNVSLAIPVMLVQRMALWRKMRVEITQVSRPAWRDTTVNWVSSSYNLIHAHYSIFVYIKSARFVQLGYQYCACGVSFSSHHSIALYTVNDSVNPHRSLIGTLQKVDSGPFSEY